MTAPDPLEIQDNLITRTIHDASSLSAPITTVGLGSARWVESEAASTREGPKEFEALDNLIKQTILDTTPPTSIGLGSVKWVEWLDTFNEEHNIQAGLVAYNDSTKEAGLTANLGTLSISNKEFHHVPAMNAGESPIKWIHCSEKLLEEEIPINWDSGSADGTANTDFLSHNPVKFTQSQCTKCNRKFFSNINLRRHVRASHPPSEVEKENVDKMKIQVAAFWDQLSQEQACDLVDRDELSLPALPTRHLFDTLVAQLEIFDVLGIPPAFYNSASCIMDAIKDMPTRYPISSREWLVYLGVLSENNLFWGGTNLPSEMPSLFDNDPQRVGQDEMNTFASLALLVGSALVKAWDKHQRDLTLLHYKELIEMEEAANNKK